MIFFPPSDGIPNSTNGNVLCFRVANKKPGGYYDTGGCGSTEGRLSEQYSKFSGKCFVFTPTPAKLFQERMKWMVRMKKSVSLLYFLDGLWAFYWSILESLGPEIYGICVLPSAQFYIHCN